MRVGLVTLGDHRPDPTTGKRTSQQQKHQELLDYIDFAAPAGFSTVIVGEHHFSDFIISVPQVFLAWVAARHPDIGLATGVTLLPHHDPVRLAEDFATLDVVSNGRAELWVGKGVEPKVYAQFGQDASRATDMQDEGLRLLLRLWTEENVTWSGEFRPPLTDVTLEPRPIQQPHPPIYVAVSSPESARSAAGLGLGITATLLAFERETLPQLTDAYLEAWADAGHTHEPKITLNAHMHVAPTSQEAYDHLGIYQFPFQKWVFGKRFGLDPDTLELPARITELHNPESAIVCGSAEEVLDRIGRIAATCPFDRLTYQGDYGGQPWSIVKRSLDLFATEVMANLPDSISPTAAFEKMERQTVG